MKPRFSVLILLVVASSHVHAQKAIDTTQTMLIGGIKQFIAIKGKDSAKPILLFLHGGPGGSVMQYGDKFTRRLQEHFVVIQWDQRETGKTLELNTSVEPLTVELFESDTQELIASLLGKFKKPKLYLVAHSWGTVLGFHIARNYPELLHAYIPVAPMINQLESERIILNMMKERAVVRGNQKEAQELSAVKIPFENGEQLYYHRKWLLHFNGSTRNFTRAFALTWSSTWLNVYNEACRDNLNLSLPVINCPVYFFVGRKDYQTNSMITESYFNSLVAPEKQLFWFERSAHSVPTSEPDRFQQIIIDKVLKGKV